MGIISPKRAGSCEACGLYSGQLWRIVGSRMIVCRRCHNLEKLFGAVGIQAWLPMTTKGGLSVNWSPRLQRWLNRDVEFARATYKARYLLKQKVAELLRAELSRATPRAASPWVVGVLSGRGMTFIVRKIVRYYIWLVSRDATCYSGHPKTVEHCQASLVAYLLRTTHSDCGCRLTRNTRKAAALFTALRNIVVELEAEMLPLIRLVCRKVCISESQAQPFRKPPPDRVAEPLDYIWPDTSHIPQVRKPKL